MSDIVHTFYVSESTTVTWTYNGYPIPSENNPHLENVVISGDSFELTIESAQRINTGVFMCSNGHAMKQFYINVIPSGVK